MLVNRAVDFRNLCGLGRNGFLQSRHIGLQARKRGSMLVNDRLDARCRRLDVGKRSLHSGQRFLNVGRRCFQPGQRGALLCEGCLHILDGLQELRKGDSFLAVPAFHRFQFIGQVLQLLCQFIGLFYQNGFCDVVLLCIIVEENAVLHVAGFRVPRSHGNVLVRILHLGAGNRRTPGRSQSLCGGAAPCAAGLGNDQTIIRRHRNAAIVGAHFQKHLIAVLVAVCQIRILPGGLGVGRCADGIRVADIQRGLHGIDGAVYLISDFDLIAQLRCRVKHRIRGRERLVLDAVQHGIEVVADALTGIGAVVHGDFKTGIITLRVRVAFLVRHGDLGHHKPLAGDDRAAHERHMDKALFSLDCAGLVVDQREAVCRYNAVEFMVNDRIDHRDQRANTAAGLRGLRFSAAAGQLPRQRVAIAGDDVVVAIIHDAVGFRGRRGQRHQPEHTFVRDSPVAAVAGSNPAKNLLHGVPLRIRDHVVQAAIDAGARVKRSADAVRDFLHHNGHGLWPVAFAVAIVHHGLRGLEHRIIAGQRIEIFRPGAGIDPELAKRQRLRMVSNVQICEPCDDAHRSCFRDGFAIFQQDIQLQGGCIAVADAERLRCKAVTDLRRRNTEVFFARNDSASVHIEPPASCQLSPLLRSVPRSVSPPYCSVMLNAIPT